MFQLNTERSETTPRSPNQREDETVKVITKASQIKPEPHFLMRRGGYFRPNAKGYTENIGEAGVFSPAETIGHLKAEGVQAVPVKSMKAEIWRQAQEALAKSSHLFDLAFRL